MNNSSVQLSRESTGPCNNEISVYTGELNRNTIASEIKKLQVSFPSLEPEFFNVLSERVVMNGFSDQRLKDAIAHVIDTFTYQRPSIASIISFDHKVKLYDYHEVSELVTQNRSSFDDFGHYKKNERMFWIRKTDASKFNIPLTE